MSTGQVEAERPRAAVVSESMFGNTAAVALAVGEELRRCGVDVDLWDVAQAPAPGDLDVDLLVVGAPTHAFSLSRPGTRAEAVQQGADPGHGGTGVREWVASAPSSPRPDRYVAFFDTRASRARHLPGSAARAASRLARHHLGRPAGTASFFVADTGGPLVDGELERAREFARTLSRVVVRHPLPSGG